MFALHAGCSRGAARITLKSLAYMQAKATIQGMRREQGCPIHIVVQFVIRNCRVGIAGGWG